MRLRYECHSLAVKEIVFGNVDLIARIALSGAHVFVK